MDVFSSKKGENYIYHNKEPKNFMGTCYIYKTENPLSFKRNETFENLNILVNKEKIFSFEEVKRYGMCNLMNLEYTISTIDKLVTSPQSGGKYYEKTFNRPMGKAKAKEEKILGRTKYIGKNMRKELKNSEKHLNSGYLFSGLQKINNINCQVFLKVKASGENAEKYTLEEIVLIPFNKEICNSQNQTCSSNLSQKFIPSTNDLQNIINFYYETLKKIQNKDVGLYLTQLYNFTFLLLLNDSGKPLNDYLQESEKDIHEQLKNIFEHYGLSG